MRLIKVLPVLLMLGLSLSSLPARAAFSGDNGDIAFVKSNRIFLMSFDGSGQRDLSGNSSNQDNNPAWSPDAKNIAFDTIEGAHVPNIWLANRNNQNRRNIAEGRGGYIEGTDPTWAPNGLKVAYTSTSSGGTTEISTITSDGVERKTLTSNSFDDFQASYSPDGHSIAFVSDRDGNDEIYVMNADGSGQTRITNNAVADSYPSWSPNGSKLAFDSGGELWVSNADGSGATQLTTGAQASQGVAFSPNGQQIAFSANINNNVDIYKINVDGTNQLRLTTDSAVETLPDWNRIPIQGGSDADTLTGSGVVDVILGEGGDDTIDTGGGDDIGIGGDGADVLRGQAGDDVLAGEELETSPTDPNGSADKLDGGSGNDLLLGGGGNDRFKGGKGKDKLRGDVGDDVLDGGDGYDTLVGGKGKDTCVVDSKKEERHATGCEHFRRHF